MDTSPSLYDSRKDTPLPSNTCFIPNKTVEFAIKGIQ